MTKYRVFVGSYGSDYSLLAVYSERKHADNLIELLRLSEKSFCWNIVEEEEKA